MPTAHTPPTKKRQYDNSGLIFNRLCMGMLAGISLLAMFGSIENNKYPEVPIVAAIGLGVAILGWIVGGAVYELECSRKLLEDILKRGED